MNHCLFPEHDDPPQHYWLIVMPSGYGLFCVVHYPIVVDDLRAHDVEDFFVQSVNVDTLDVAAKLAEFEEGRQRQAMYRMEVVQRWEAWDSDTPSDLDAFDWVESALSDWEYPPSKEYTYGTEDTLMADLHFYGEQFMIVAVPEGWGDSAITLFRIDGLHREGIVTLPFEGGGTITDGNEVLRATAAAWDDAHMRYMGQEYQPIYYQEIRDDPSARERMIEAVRRKPATI